MAKRIISYFKELFQDYASKDYTNQALSLEGLVMLIFKEIAESKQAAQKDIHNPLQSNDSEDSVTEE